MDAVDPVGQAERQGLPSERRMTLGAGVYVVAAAFVGGLWFIAGSGQYFGSDIGIFGPLTLGAGVASVLVGAALHIRHRDAWSSHRPIAIAVALQAVGGVLQPLASILVAHGWFAASLGSPGAIQMGFALTIATSVLGIMSSALLWVGIRRARRQPAPAGLRPVSVGIWILAILLASNSVWSLRSMVESTTIPSALIGVQQIVVNVGQILLSAALTVTLVAGARSGERPNRAWWLAAVAKLVVLIGMIAYPFVLVAAGVVSNPVLYVQLPQAIALIGALFMLGAFALGLPSDDRLASE